MSSGWELPPSRVRTLDSLPSFVGSGVRGQNRPGSPSSSSETSSPNSSLQHIPAYNYFDSQQQAHYRLYLQQKSGSGSGSGNSSGQKNHKRSSGGDVRQYRHKMLERAAYTNRSFMHHNEYDLQRSGFVFESSHYGLEYGEERPRKADRRRHSMHHIAKDSTTAKPSKMDDLKHRFDEYSSSAAVERGGGGGRRPSRHGGGQFVVGGAIAGGVARLGHAGTGAGSRSLEVYDSQWVPVAMTTEGTRRQKERGVPTNGGQSATKTPKRGSRSSQGSTDSSHSSHSASSGSLLLTVANLENFAKIHKKHESSYGTSRAMEEYLSSTVGVVPTAAILDAVGSKYNTNIVLKSATNPEHPAGTSSGAAIISIEEITSDSQSQQQQDPMTLGRTTAGLTKATKDPDSVSMASSTHFTMINGVGGPQRLPKGGLCSRGRQITVLIVTMSIVFMVGICAAVFFLESECL
ncbi:hypothetical protein quinque_003033 [Culex quinquefasciatus]